MLKNLIHEQMSNGRRFAFKNHADISGIASHSKAERDEIIERASRAYAELLFFIKNDGFAMVRDSIDFVKTYAEEAFNKDNRTAIPSVVYVSHDQDMVELVSNSIKMQHIVISHSSSLPDTFDVNTLNGDVVAKEKLSLMDKKTIDETIASVNRIMRGDSIFKETGANTEKLTNIFYLMKCVVASEPLRGSLGTVSNYKHDTNALLTNVTEALRMNINKYEQMMENEILLIDVRDNTIYVVGALKGLFYSRGGEIEMLYGLAYVKDRPKSIKRILEFKSPLLQAFKEAETTINMSRLSSSRGIYTKAYLELIDRLFADQKEDISFAYTNKNMKIEFHRLIAPMHTVDIAKIKPIVTFIMSKLLENYDFGTFVKYIEHYRRETPDIDMQSLANVALMEMITDMVVDNMEIYNV